MLQATDITKNYFRETNESNYFTALESCSMELYKGTLSVLMGRSGSGKTTLLSILAGLLKPTSGTVNVNSRDIYKMSEMELSRFRNENIGVIPQGYTALFNLTVAENIMLPACMYNARGERDKKLRDRTRQLLERFGIYGLRKESPKNLSGGELRRMAIARGVITNPDIILADEPTGDLDDKNTIEVFKFFRELADDGSAVFIVSHEESALDYADVRYKMNAGVLSRQ